MQLPGSGYVDQLMFTTSLYICTVITGLYWCTVYTIYLNCTISFRQTDKLYTVQCTLLDYAMFMSTIHSCKFYDTHISSCERACAHQYWYLLFIVFTSTFFLPCSLLRMLNRMLIIPNSMGTLNGKTRAILKRLIKSMKKCLVPPGNLLVFDKHPEDLLC